VRPSLCPAAWREAAAGTLDPAYNNSLARVPGWADSRREGEDEARWHHRFAQLVANRGEGNDWPRYRNADSERKHTLGVGIHTERYTRRRGELDRSKSSSWTMPFPDGRPEDPGPYSPAVTGLSRVPAVSGLGTSTRLVELWRFSGPPSLENREPPRLSPGFARRLPPTSDPAALLPRELLNPERRPEGTACLPGCGDVRRPAWSRGFPQPTGQGSTRRVRGPEVTSVGDVRQVRPARRAEARGGQGNRTLPGRPS